MNKLFDPRTTGGLVAILVIIVVAIAAILVLGPEWLAQVSSIGIPIAMTSKKDGEWTPMLFLALTIITIILTGGGLITILAR